jgi:hypothetical protein
MNRGMKVFFPFAHAAMHGQKEKKPSYFWMSPLTSSKEGSLR